MKFTAIIIITLLISSCSSSKKASKNINDEMPQSPSEQKTKDFLVINGNSDFGNAGNLKTVYFDYNSLNLNASSQKDIESNILFLQQYPNVKILIEGHADERGGVQYNLTLGERRAEKIKSYLIAKGILTSRISAISFGKEKPIEFGHDEEAWSKNRRANFIVTDK